jgi:hypothetical protein
VPNGIYFTRIEAIGLEKQNTFITFDRGLNVVSGASDTGKSYLVDCMDFILGAMSLPTRIVPKEIKEAKGYDEIRAEIKTFEGKTFTLSRHFNDNRIHLAECSFENFKTNSSVSLSTTHSDRNDENISIFLLKLIRMAGKKLKTNGWNVTRGLSFRDLARFCLVDENRIIEKDSPIFTGQRTEDTANKSLFKLLLTGEDDESLESMGDPKIIKSNIKGKIEVMERDIENKKKYLLELKKRAEGLNSEHVNLEIQRLINIVEEAHKEVLAEETHRGLIWTQLDRLMAELSQYQDLEKKFKLLNEHYSSDINRLEFINEGKNGLDQLKEVNCPLCNSLIDKKVLEAYSDEANFQLSITNEYSKIMKKQADLILTIQEVQMKIDVTKTQVDQKRKEFEAIDKYLSDKLRPVHFAHADNLNKFLSLKSDQGQIALIESELADLSRDLDYQYVKLQEKQQRAPEKIMPEQIYLELSTEVKRILLSWGVEVRTVRYDPEANDIDINGEKRSNSGKGYRAIYLSAFMVAVLLYCNRMNLKHPNFLVLDSPLTAYKEKDIGGSNVDTLPEEIQNRFYESLASLPEISDVQIIVIDNKEPPDSLKTRINYEHFSKNEKYGRYGFYPIIDHSIEKEGPA